ncbi:MAG: UDP-N-acetylmuramate--L-alanine ligase [Deltaproteobacteria bacterium]|jgi:UDP-N-acetylmuramate--alanine ligase|nr:UDP-N-acetylmuramate--L-alanine ligase [Deltaproteobacteria bacterium]
MYHKTRSIHFVGIGGIGMSGIAEVLMNLGHQVSGSDLQENAQTRRLSSMGAKIFVGHRSDQIHGSHVLVISSAVSDLNPEIVEAKRLSVPVIPRAEMLAELMRLKTSVAVAGAHGKTSTCSIIGMMLTEAGLDPTLVIGGKINNLGVNARLGQGELMVAEADESDGSFLLLSPTVTVVTNIDREHMNYYSDMAHLEEAFLAFINRVPFYGASILCTDDLRVRALLGKVKKRVITYGLNDSEITAQNVSPKGWGYSYDLMHNNQKLTTITVNLPGRHNVLNSLAAAAVGLELGLSPSQVASGIAGFKGVGRRFELKGTSNGVTVVDDYGHHPTEIRSTLAALAECFPDRRRVVLFQPHRFSRTLDLFEEFTMAFTQADLVLLSDIYAASEESIEGLTSGKLAEGILSSGQVMAQYLAPIPQMAQAAITMIRPGDVVLTLGAGNIYQVGEEILKLLKARDYELAKSKSA